MHISVEPTKSAGQAHNSELEGASVGKAARTTEYKETVKGNDKMIRTFKSGNY